MLPISVAYLSMLCFFISLAFLGDDAKRQELKTTVGNLELIGLDVDSLKLSFI